VSQRLLRAMADDEPALPRTLALAPATPRIEPGATYEPDGLSFRRIPSLRTAETVVGDLRTREGPFQWFLQYIADLLPPWSICAT
jgi:hypothetical protein